MTMDISKVRQVFDLALDKTRAGSVAWADASAPLSGSAGIYEYKTERGYILRVFPFTTNPEEINPIPSMTISDAEGALVFDVTEESDVASSTELQELYLLVENFVTRTDEKLENIISDLTSLTGGAS